MILGRRVVIAARSTKLRLFSLLSPVNTSPPPTQPRLVHLSRSFFAAPFVCYRSVSALNVFVGADRSVRFVRWGGRVRISGAAGLRPAHLSTPRQLVRQPTAHPRPETTPPLQAIMNRRRRPTQTRRNKKRRRKK